MSFGFCLLHLWEWVLCRPKQFGLLSALWFADWQLSLLRLDVFYRSGFLGAELHTLSAIVFHQQNAMLFLHGRSPLLPSLPEQLPMPTMRELLLPQLHPQLHKLLIPYAWLHGLQLRTVPELRLRVLPREQLLHPLQHGCKLLQPMFAVEWEHKLPGMSIGVLSFHKFCMCAL